MSKVYWWETLPKSTIVPQPKIAILPKIEGNPCADLAPVTLLALDRLRQVTDNYQIFYINAFNLRIQQGRIDNEDYQGYIFEDAEIIQGLVEVDDEAYKDYLRDTYLCMIIKMPDGTLTIAVDSSLRSSLEIPKNFPMHAKTGIIPVTYISDKRYPARNEEEVPF